MHDDDQLGMLAHPLSNSEEKTMAQVGSKVADFKLKAHDGSEVSPSQFSGTKWLVISAYPFAFTGG